MSDKDYATGGLVSLEDIKIMKAKLSDDENDVYAEIIQKRIDDAMKKQLMEIIDSFADVNASFDVSYATSSNVKGFDIGNFEKLVEKVEGKEVRDVIEIGDSKDYEYLGYVRKYGMYRMMVDGKLEI